jgi:hypothetical protein
VPYALVATLCVAICAPLRADEPGTDLKPAAALTEAWWDVAQRIERGKPWADCAEQLRTAIELAGPTSVTVRCTKLLMSIRSAADFALPSEPLYDDANEDTLIAALQEAKPDYRLILNPLQIYANEPRLAWDMLAQFNNGGSDAAAYLLFLKGRDAIPYLIDALDDLRATRAVSVNRSYHKVPLVPRVCDVSLALIEAISLCRLNFGPTAYDIRTTKPPLFSEWSADKRARQIALVHEWWAATQRLSAEDAVVWRLERADREDQMQMLDALIWVEQRELAIDFLQSRFIDEWKLDRGFSGQLLRAGSRAPLDAIHEAYRAKQPLSHDMIVLILEYGAIDDFRLLRDALRNPENSEFPLDHALLANQLNYCDNPLAVPILVTILELDAAHKDRQSSPSVIATGAQIPGYLRRTGERIEALTGRNFGMSAPENAAKSRAIENILRWWPREGQGAYDYERIRPHAPAGIR